MKAVRLFNISSKSPSFLRFLAAALVSLTVLMPISVSVNAKPEVASQQVQQSVNINKASADEIAQVLNGVGKKKAAAIVAYRKANGAFKSLADLTKVKGIGEATLNKNKSRIKI